ncbi:MAG: Gfo/Idh/MocA family protein [Rhodothermales bacterium]
MNFIEAGLAYHVSDPTLWRLDRRKGGGRAIMDLGVYPIQACRYATGEEPVAVTAQGFTHDKDRFKDIYETFFWQFEFPSGTVANCTTSYSSYVDRFYASCYKGWYRLHPSFNGGGSGGETSDGPMNLTKVNQQAAHMDDFAQSIIEGSPLRVNASEGLQDLRIIEAIKLAIESGERVGVGA